VESSMPKVMESAYYFEQAGVGLGIDETYCVFLPSSDLLKYTQSKDAASGTRSWRYDGVSKANEDQKDKLDRLPSPCIRPHKRYLRKKPEQVVTNTSNPIRMWVKLLSVMPTQIVTARNIKKFFSEHLDMVIIRYLPFPGNESNYLRAQIGHISAGTYVSPLGFYQISIQLGSFYAVHSSSGSLYLVQSCTKNEKEEKEDEEKEHKGDEPDSLEQEAGPPPLTPMSEDLEYPSGLEITEMEVPNVGEEQASRATQEAIVLSAEENEETDDEDDDNDD
ncbi:hypothetical protein U0070_017835, partial [Myodes glareolus]